MRPRRSGPIAILLDMDVLQAVRAEGGYATARALAQRGISPGRLRAATQRGEVWKPRKGHYLDPALGADVARAVRVGGVLTCVSVLRGAGAWVPDDRRIHVALAQNSSRLRSPTDRHTRFVADGRVVLHWRDDVAETDIVSVLACVARCCSRRDFFVCLESAIALDLVSGADQRRIRAALPRSLRSLVDAADGLSGSGGESMFKYALLEARIPFRQQVLIPGVGRVDFLIGDALIVEIDSRAHHSDPLVDRHRDLGARIGGRRTLRFLYAQVDEEPRRAVDAVRKAMRDGDHLLRARDRSAGERVD